MDNPLNTLFKVFFYKKKMSETIHSSNLEHIHISKITYTAIWQKLKNLNSYSSQRFFITCVQKPTLSGSSSNSIGINYKMLN
jgi:hypothetical protein